MVEALLGAGANVNKARKTDEVTPLYIASQNGHLGVVKALIFAGADVTLRFRGCLPINISNSKGHTEIVKLLSNVSSADERKHIFRKHLAHLRAGDKKEGVKTMFTALCCLKRDGLRT